MDELRLSLRRLRKHPAATLVSIVTLACGIGAAAATWSLLSALLLRPLAVHEPGNLVVVGVRSPVRSDPSRVYDGHNYLAQHPIDGFAIDFTVRARGDLDAARREVVAAIRSIDAGIAPPTVLTIDERLMQQLGAQRFGAFVLGALAMIAVLLTVLGTYVLAESMAVLRTREMGIRAALGATGRQLSAIVLFDTARLVGLGIVIGLGLAWLGAGTIRALLFRVQPMDPVTLVPVSLMILVLAVVVTLRPALRVARVDLARC